MEETGREERGGEEGGERRDGSLHPLEFSKVGAYDYTRGPKKQLMQQMYKYIQISIERCDTVHS